MNKLQFRIQSAEAKDEARVAEMFAGAAATFHLLDIKVTSRDANTICMYSDSLDLKFGLGAWKSGEQIVVQFEPGNKPTDTFHAVFDHVTTLLRTEFADRFVMPAAENYAKVPNVLPANDAARSIYRSVLKKNQADGT